ncbi:glycerophosphodiester phosphodiesterase family protein [Corynebacterium breve]|uniref:Glycerophosphodiester phosphodiesterase family protein n=1 Tax=Corynebacterium breve TaxID=3049799 RepID=A0ABY8VH34_9CORY|nr:glycerophosphodiester phosphodiesterase family protein [Corynebacterium breve]WIM67534.1 glycerophosphodiester phosphodiesterase family protein [Corynebacterium breve]
MKIVAHRGYSGKYPELTHRAFDEALKLPIDGVECDVRLTRDGRLVVQHDKTIDRTSDGTGLVAKMDFEELRQFNVGTEDDPQRILLLDELLELMQDYPDKELYLETKHPSRFGPEVEEQVAVRLRYAGLHEDPRINLISFSHAAMRRFARLLPALDCYYLVDPRDARWNRNHIFFSKPAGVGPSITQAKADPVLVGLRGMNTYMWTVDDPDDMIWCRDNGVDVMATNLPELALETLR